MPTKTPDSPFARLFPDAVQANLDYIIDRQDPAGHWNPNWTWGGLYPDAWPQAERDVRSYLTLTNLKRLRAWGRL